MQRYRNIRLSQNSIKEFFFLIFIFSFEVILNSFSSTPTWLLISSDLSGSQAELNGRSAPG